jgi:hypothetical protein
MHRRQLVVGVIAVVRRGIVVAVLVVYVVSAVVALVVAVAIVGLVVVIDVIVKLVVVGIVFLGIVVVGGGVVHCICRCLPTFTQPGPPFFSLFPVHCAQPHSLLHRHKVRLPRRRKTLVLRRLLLLRRLTLPLL